jgi:hypothetical protein
MNSLEQFYIQLYVHIKKTSTRTKPGRIQLYIPFCLQPSELSLYIMTLTYINPRSDAVTLVQLPQTNSEHVTADTVCTV